MGTHQRTNENPSENQQETHREPMGTLREQWVPHREQKGTPEKQWELSEKE